MKSVLYFLCFGLFLSTLGCQKPVDIPLPPTDFDFIENKSGILSARILSIDFLVHANAGGVSTSTDIEANFVEPAKSKHNICVTIGDDWTIDLKAVNETMVQFEFREQKLGVLKVDDQVSIDEEGNVKVNGVLRLPSESTEEQN